jgi:hypothetical protein
MVTQKDFVMETDRPEGMTISASAALLGIPEFSLIRRGQLGQIETERARTGEMVVPAATLEQLLPGDAEKGIPSPDVRMISDDALGIEQTRGGLKRNGEYPVKFRVPGFASTLGETEIESYRKAFSAISDDMNAVKEISKQLDHPETVLAAREREISTPNGQWEVQATLLNLSRSDILLCHKGFNQFAVIEQFPGNSPFARAAGQSHFISEGDSAKEVAQEFRNDARHTLRLMASNAVAKAQKIVWERYADNRPAQVVAAISERCRQAVASNQSISEGRDMHVQTGGGVHV